MQQDHTNTHTHTHSSPLRSKIIQCAYEVKFVQGLPQPALPGQSAAAARRRPLFTSPLYASRAEVRGWLRAFGEECGAHYLSEDGYIYVYHIYVYTTCRWSALSLLHAPSCSLVYSLAYTQIFLSSLLSVFLSRIHTDIPL
jgi:hypothetical protein